MRAGGGADVLMTYAARSAATLTSSMAADAAASRQFSQAKTRRHRRSWHRWTTKGAIPLRAFFHLPPSRYTLISGSLWFFMSAPDLLLSACAHQDFARFCICVMVCGALSRCLRCCFLYAATPGAWARQLDGAADLLFISPCHCSCAYRVLRVPAAINRRGGSLSA